MRSGKLLFLSVLLFALSFAGATFAAQDRYVRLRSVEGDVTVYPSDSDRPNEATVNTPLLDGDEIQTGDGRAELSFRNGITVRIGDYSGLRIESTYSPMRINLSQGTVFIDSHLIDRFQDELELRAGDAQVYLIDEGNIRVDLGTEGSVRITTLEGQAEVRAGGRRVLLNSGERTYVDPGSGPDRPEAFNGQTDELDDWNQSQMDNYAQGGYGGGADDQYLDEDMYYDGNDLSSYGDWRYEGTYGNVWVPHVDYGWRPYNDGRWEFCNGSWFWISSEPWGWAPYHYGRWGWGSDLGWYWIPGNTFAAAWVSWYSYGDYIGWCPLNYYNHPIYYGDHQYPNYNYPSIVKQKTLNVENSWNFVKKNDLGIRNVKQALLDPSHVRNIHIDKNQVLIAPKKELVSYVIPKTQLTPALVNDKRMIKTPEDIKNPLGIKNKEEQFERNPILRSPRDNQNSQPKEVQHGHNTFTLPKSNSNVDRNDHIDRNDHHDRNNDSNKPIPKSFTPPKSDKEKPNYDKSNNSNRDWQFKRNESKNHHSSPFLNPYYKGRSNNQDDSDPRNRNFDTQKRDYESFKHYDPRDDNNDSRNRDYDSRKYDSFDRYQDVNPKYRDEAKKYFERFDHKNRPDMDQPDLSPRNYDRPDSSPRNYDRPDPSPRNYESPKRDYHAPEIHRPEFRQPSNNNNSSHSRPSNNSHNDKPGKPHN
jgi:hypothetical protein